MENSIFELVFMLNDILGDSNGIKMNYREWKVVECFIMIR